VTWTVNYTQDTDKPGVGTLVATFDDGAGLTASYGDRVDTTSDFGGFIQKAKDTLAAKQKMMGDMAAIRTKIEAALNA